MNVNLKLGDFSPDLDLVVQGFDRKKIPNVALAYLSDAQWVYSSIGGYKNMPALHSIASPLPSKCVGAYGAEVGGAFIIVEATYNQLYLNIGGLLINQNLVLGNTQNPWYFTVYGDDLLATNGADPVQVSTNGGTFAALGGSPPIFSIVEATPYSLFGIVPVSNQYYFTLNDTIWTPSIATVTGTGVLAATSGIIRAAKQLRGGIAMFKQNSLYYGLFSGPPLFWNFSPVSTQVGTHGPNSAVAVDTTIYFVGPDDFWQFDGYSLQRIPNNLKGFFFTDMDLNFDDNIFAVYDSPRSQIFFYYPSVNADPAGSLDSYVSYSLRTGKWLRGNINIDTPLNGVLFTSTPWTWGHFQDTYVTYAGVPALVYGANLFSGNTNTQFAVVDSSHTLQAFRGTGTQVASITTGDLGDKQNIYRITRARAGFLEYPADASRAKMTVFATYNQGQDYNAQTQPIPLAAPTGYHDFVSTNRLQRLKLQWDLDAEVADMDVNIDFVGSQ